MAKKQNADATEPNSQPAGTENNTAASETVASEPTAPGEPEAALEETAGEPGEGIQVDGQGLAPVAPAKETTEAAPAHATTTLSAAAQVISSSATKEDPIAGLTKVLIQYPEGFTGDRFYENGTETHVEPSLAEHFVNLGIASIQQ